MTEKVSDISRKNEKRYSERYENLGYDIQTIGWGSENQQQIRFKQTFYCGVELGGKEILDIGCGFGDYMDFLTRHGVSVDSYEGWDLSPNLIEEAQDRYGEHDSAQFEVRDLFEVEPRPIADVAVMIGLLNLKYEEVDNYNYSKKAIRRAFGLVREGLIVDFLSVHRTEDYPREEFVFYHDPSVMLDFAFELTGDVRLKHDYEPIPQKEFMITLVK
ncbi:SAM-dependent methyltransferase [Salinibacter ruber]|uniref:class I SAM-dependent methyltransferase n=1 Tax=Salinibacter ruber TaxID=146919 RepID=UPI00216811D7|nr:class I SAM-dependent methyltransferase [Salinibacter ruber]MCS3634883.1 SAM-dependent methyltransferase [Salinibacter ruber]MCS3714642.1 SAM-dependent methyltransferase [Salinibacter ruber]